MYTGHASAPLGQYDDMIQLVKDYRCGNGRKNPYKLDMNTVTLRYHGAGERAVNPTAHDAMRGVEYVLEEVEFKKGTSLNQNRPISVRNANRKVYLAAAQACPFRDPH